jgi:hypothetical protein
VECGAGWEFEWEKEGENDSWDSFFIFIIDWEEIGRKISFMNFFLHLTFLSIGNM